MNAKIPINFLKNARLWHHREAFQNRPFIGRFIRETSDNLMIYQSIELHDSVLAVLWYGQHNEAVLIFSSLYIHQSEGVPGVDSGIGWFQRAELEIKNASVNAEFIRDFPFQIFDGETIIDGVVYRNTMPLPLKAENSFRIILNGIDDESHQRRIDIEGNEVKLTLLGEIYGTEKFTQA